jgi:hypothetical protein
MSSISSISAGQQSVLDQVQAQNQQRHGWGGGLDDLLQAAGADPSKVSSIAQQIHDAIQGVRQGAGDDADKKAAVKQAVDKVLQDNGVDPAKFDAAAKAGKGRKHRGGHHKGGGQAQANTAVNGTATTATTAAQGVLNGTLMPGQVDVEG